MSFVHSVLFPQVQSLRQVFPQPEPLHDGPSEHLVQVPETQTSPNRQSRFAPHCWQLPLAQVATPGLHIARSVQSDPPEAVHWCELQYRLSTHSALLLHTVLQVPLGPQERPFGHCSVLVAGQISVEPSQWCTPLSVLRHWYQTIEASGTLVHGSVMHTVDALAGRQAPAPSHLSAQAAVQKFRGSVPTGIGEQVPSLVLTLQAMQPLQSLGDLSQQTPSVQ